MLAHARPRLRQECVYSSSCVFVNSYFNIVHSAELIIKQENTET